MWASVTVTGAYIGVAPKVNIVDIKICNNQGEVSISDVVEGLQWVYKNKDEHNIRVVNVSLHSSVLLILALVLPLVVLAPSGVPRAQPGLLQMAAERPDETVPVIVQKWGTDTGAEDLLRPITERA